MRLAVGPYSERESNPHGHCWPQDFKSGVSTDSTIRAQSFAERRRQKYENIYSSLPLSGRQKDTSRDIVAGSLYLFSAKRYKEQQQSQTAKSRQIKRHDRNSRTAPIGMFVDRRGDLRHRAQVAANLLLERAGALAVDDGDGAQLGHDGAVDIVLHHALGLQRLQAPDIQLGGGAGAAIDLHRAAAGGPGLGSLLFLLL